jgi:acyl-CoA thioesterase FadM
MRTTHDFQVYRDEFDPHLSTHLPLRNILNLFERARTNILGGPDGLRRLQKEEGLLYVVTGIDQCSLVTYSSAQQRNGETPLLMAGESLTVATNSILKRGGSMIECQQTAMLGEERVAQALVSIYAISEQTRRPFKKLPQWVLENLVGAVADEIELETDA